jgi:hypothetical protein
VTPVFAQPTAGTIVLALATLAALYVADRAEPLAAAAGAALLLVELEHVWHDERTALQLAAALSACALLAAFELRSWARQLHDAPASRRELQAHGATLARRFALVTAATAVFALLARAPVHEPILGLAGAIAAIALLAGLLLQTRFALSAGGSAGRQGTQADVAGTVNQGTRSGSHEKRR